MIAEITFAICCLALCAAFIYKVLVLGGKDHTITTKRLQDQLYTLSMTQRHLEIDMQGMREDHQFMQNLLGMKKEGEE